MPTDMSIEAGGLVAPMPSATRDAISFGMAGGGVGHADGDRD
jgi:hypothetical protein